MRRAPRVLTTAVAVLVTGCMTWRPIDTVPLVLFAPANPNRPSEILIKTAAGGKEFLRSPRLSADTLVGMPLTGGPESAERRVPLDSVLVIETQGFSGSTFGIVFLTMIGVAAGLALWVTVHVGQ